MRTDIIRWGGLAAVALALVFAVALLIGFTMGVDIYADDDTAELLRDIDANGVAFVAWSLLNAAGNLLLIPLAAGLFFTVRERDRPYFAMVVAALGLSAVVSVVGYGLGPVLWDVSENFVDAEPPARDALLHDGENLQSMLLMIGGLSLTPFGLAMIGVSLLSRRAAYFPAWLDWPAMLVGLVGAVPFVGFTALVPGRIIWLLLVGVILINRSRAEPVAAGRAEPSAMPA